VRARRCSGWQSAPGTRGRGAGVEGKLASRFNILLFIAVIASGLYLVNVSSRARNLFVDLEKAQNEEHALETQYEQLQVEKRAQATPLRVEKVAREKLNMRTASASVTQYVTYCRHSRASRRSRACRTRTESTR
jgi:cell division protein FtsL